MLTKEDFIKDFFYKLDEINYVVLRSYDKIPNNVTGDIDLLIKKKDYKTFLSILDKLKKNNNIIQLKIIDREYVRMFKLLYIKEGKSFGLKIDIHFHEMWRGAIYLPTDDVLKRKLKYNNIFIPSYEDQFIINLFQMLLGMGYLNNKRIEKIEALTNKVDLLKLKNLLIEIVGIELTELIINKLEKNEINSLHKYHKQLRKKIYFNSLNKDLSYTIILLLKIFYKNIKYKFLYPGSFIAFIGPDGAGKSTAINSVREILDQVIINDNSTLIAWKPQYLKRLAELKNDTSNDKLTKEQKKTIIPNKLSSFLRLTYYTLDYIFGHYLKNRKILTSEGYVMYDRYYFDYIIQPPERSFINLPMFIKKLFLFFVPKPDITIYFKAKKEVLFKRKQEETIDELEDLVNRYDLFVEEYSKIKTIDALDTKENVVLNLLTHIKNRYE